MGKKQLTLEFVKGEFEKEGYALLTRDYINCSQKLEYICPKGHQHIISWDNWKAGHRCAYCAGQGKPDISYLRKYFEGFGYTLLSSGYKNDLSKLKYKCPNGHTHSMRWGNFRNGKRCPSCAKINNSLSKKGDKHYNWIWNLQKEAARGEEPAFYPAFNFSPNWKEKMIIFKYIARYGYHRCVQMFYTLLKNDPYLEIIDQFIPDK